MLKAPPLSFPGNKKNYREDFVDELKRFDDTYTFVDLFGGSGYLSYVAKHVFPNARVVYNDYDGYSERIENIPTTNEILDNIKTLIGKRKYMEKLDNVTKEKIRNYFTELEDEGKFVDYITMSALLCFSNKFCDSNEEMGKCYFYNKLKVKKIKYNPNYLKGLEIINEDYKAVYDKFKNEPKVVFFIDPPYLASEKRVYRNNCWRLDNYFEMLPILREQDNWIFFTNGESYIKELLEFVDKQTEEDSKKYLNNVCIYERTNHCNYNAKFKDIMMVKSST